MSVIGLVQCHYHEGSQVGSQPPARHSTNTARPRAPAGVSRDMPVYSPNFRQVLILSLRSGG